MIGMKLIILGAPGSGKGTQAEMLRERLRVPAVSTGNILRAAITDGTALGIKAKDYVDSGLLVPDEVILDIMRERLSQDDCANGFILDGYPRTSAQAQAIDAAGIIIDAVLSIEIPDEEIERRLSGRRVCPDCGHSYHTDYNPPKSEDICDDCSARITRRADDDPQVIRDRLRVYHESTEPLKGYYEKRHILKTVVSHEDVRETTRRVLDVLGLL